MTTISKEDKKIWENYISDFNNFTINKQHINEKEVILKQNKKLFNNTQSLNNLKLLNKGRIKPQGVIDLHGYRLYAAKITLHNYIINSYQNNIRNILVITGKGLNSSGALKKEVPVWLNDKILKNLVINFKIAPKNFGGEGAMLIRLKNKYKRID